MDSHHSAPTLKRRNSSFADARRVLRTKPSGMRGYVHTQDKEMVVKADIHGILFPWSRFYRIWWWLTAFGAIFTVFFGPFMIAFEDNPGEFNDLSDLLELILTSLFAVDIAVNFNLAFYKDEIMVFERSAICKEYLSKMFWVDFVGVFPFETTALYLSGELGTTSNAALRWSLLRLLRFVRLHRMKKFSDSLQYNPRISLLWFTLIRNLGAVLTVTHLAACSLYFIARLENFDDKTWLGPKIMANSAFERYVTALYWSSK